MSPVPPGGLTACVQVMIALPFNFSFYGRTFANGSDVQVSSNGYISFESHDWLWSGNTFPVPSLGAPDFVVAVYWTDLDVSAAGILDGGVFSLAEPDRLTVCRDAIKL